MFRVSSLKETFFCNFFKILVFQRSNRKQYFKRLLNIISGWLHIYYVNVISSFLVVWDFFLYGLNVSCFNVYLLKGGSFKKGAVDYFAMFLDPCAAWG